MLFQVSVGLVLLLILLMSIRLLAVLPGKRNPPKSRTPGTTTRILIILGSGGHTAEILSVLKDLDTSKYTHRSYVVSSGDAFSRGHAITFEESLHNRIVADQEEALDKKSQVTPKVISTTSYGTFDICVIPRARYVHQSLLTTPFTSLLCLCACLKLLWRPSRASSNTPLGYPDIIISNGPATGVIVIAASIIIRLLGFPGSNEKMRTIYIESWARVRRLSLSGKILLPVVDRFIVQWESLQRIVGPRVEFRTVLE